MYEENRDNVVAILNHLNPRIIGRVTPGLKCNCGCIDCGEARAERIEPGGDGYPGHEMDYIMWSVRTRNLHTGVEEFSTGLDHFIPHEEVVSLFESYFGPRSVAVERAYADPRYRLEVDGTDRAQAGLPLAIAIQDNIDFTQFWIEWSERQSIGWELHQLTHEYPEWNCGESHTTRFGKCLDG